jgi:hypothetical protein
MTNKEAVIAALQIIGYSESAIDKALIDLEVTSDTVYSKENTKSIDLVAIEVLQGMLSVSDVKEGGYSVSYSIDGVKARIAYLQDRNGLTSTSKPTVRSRNVW